MALDKAKIITITSVKGGTGKSTVALSLAGIISKRKLKTLIVDLDLSGGAIAASLNVNFNQNIHSLVDDMMNNRFNQIEKYVSKYNDYIDILAAPNDPRDALKVHPRLFETAIRHLEYKYDIILIDTNNATSEINLIAFDRSDEIIYVMTDDLMDLKNMKSMIAIYDDMELDKYKIILNEAFGRRYSDLEIKNALNRDIDYILPKSFYDKDLQKYTVEGKILSLEKPENKGILVLQDLLDKILK